MSAELQQHDGQPTNGCLHFSGSPLIVVSARRACDERLIPDWIATMSDGSKVWTKAKPKIGLPLSANDKDQAQPDNQN